MQDAKNLHDYLDGVHDALENSFQRQAMDKFARAYPQGRANAFKDIDAAALIADIAAAKDEAISRMDELYQEFKAQAEKMGATVHLARTAGEANQIISDIAKAEDCKRIVKSKSMTAEETLLNHHLEAEGLEVVETDLGEWIIQLRHEGPSHMVMPAIHLSRGQVAGLFTKVTGKEQSDEVERLVKVARRELRQRYVQADMGVSGANFAIAESGTIGLVTNEGNARLVTTLPRVHVALCGLEKLTPNLHDALRVLKALPKNATGQAITSYVTWITGPNECAATPDNKKKLHIVFLDNGRRAMAKDEEFAEVLRCIRCGACANVCPVYRMVGGHQYGHIYIGAIGLILTYFFHGRDKAKHLVQNCINCQACKAVCAAGIDLPHLIKKIHARIQAEEGPDMQSRLLGMAMRNRKFFHGLLRAARFAQMPFGEKKSRDAKGGSFVRHLPMLLMKGQDFREIPRVADVPFRDRFKDVKPQLKRPEAPRASVALFSGCAQDFLYPEQLTAAMRTLEGKEVAVDFPMQQTCCGLPLMMMGQTEAERDVALQNMKAFDPATHDYILCLCPSCASHIKHSYPKLFAKGSDERLLAQRFADRVIDYSSFMREVVGVEPGEFRGPDGVKAAYHAPCHLCRGMEVTEAPRKLIEESGADYVESPEEQVCCGFGGSYSVKFADISKEILDNKLHNVEASGADMLVTDCPGCVMQLRGGLEKRGSNVRVRHMSELLAERKK